MQLEIQVSLVALVPQVIEVSRVLQVLMEPLDHQVQLDPQGTEVYLALQEIKVLPGL